jgi:FMN-dependent NADH-azoreductase
MLTARFVAVWREANPGGSVIHRDVGQNPLPVVSEDWIAAAFSDPASHSDAQREAIGISNKLVDELLAAHDVVVGAPMYNFTVNAALKGWIDQVVRVGRTVEYPSFTGLLTGKRTTLITTRGGNGMGPGEPKEQYDALVPYMRQILGFIGVTDLSVIYAGSQAGTEEERARSIEIALGEAETAARR